MTSQLNKKLTILSIGIFFIGAIMKIQHWTTFAGLISWIGVIAYIILLNIEISTLKKCIEKFKNH